MIPRPLEQTPPTADVANPSGDTDGNRPLQAFKATSLPATGRGAPSWIGRGAGAHQVDGKRLLVGIGWARGVKNRSLARTAAQNRARAELARLVGSQGNNSQGGTLLRFVQTPKLWQDRSTGTLFAMAQVSLEDTDLDPQQAEELWTHLNQPAIP